MTRRHLFLLTLLVAAVVAGGFGTEAAYADHFCEECHDAGNCCNPDKVLCVDCGDEAESADSAAHSTTGELVSSGALPSVSQASEDFCDECHDAGNCCNPDKVLCVDCGDEPQSTDSLTLPQLGSLFEIPTSCAPTSVAAVR